MLKQHLLLLAHGAGAGINSDFMKSIVHELNDTGLQTTSFNFPYMKIMNETGRRRPPDRMPKLLESFHKELRHYKTKYPQTKIIIGGKSMGGRVASLLTAQLEERNEDLIAACVCLGFPFHPPKKPEKYRGEHLENLKTPTLILQGDRDTMGTKAEVEKYRLSKSVCVKYIPDGDHSFTPRVRSGRTLEENVAMIRESIIDFVNALPNQVARK